MKECFLFLYGVQVKKVKDEHALGPGPNPGGGGPAHVQDTGDVSNPEGTIRCELRRKCSKCLIAGAAAAGQGAAPIPETGGAPRAPTRNGPETGTGGHAPDPGEMALVCAAAARVACEVMG